MNTYLLSLIEKTVKEAIEDFAVLPWIKPAVHINETELLQIQMQSMLDFYMGFFQKIGFLPQEIDFYKKTYCFNRRISDFNPGKKDDLLKEFAFILEQFSTDIRSRIIPIHLHYTDKTNFYLITGLAVTDDCGKNIKFMYHEFVIARKLINILSRDLVYIQRCLEEYNIKMQQSLRTFVTSLNKNYKQFQKDSRIYLEDTFYQFFIKTKMIGASHDILFTSMSMKEIAYHNQFKDYLNMYRIFNHRYHISFVDIPRFRQMF